MASNFLPYSSGQKIHSEAERGYIHMVFEMDDEGNIKAVDAWPKAAGPEAAIKFVKNHPREGKRLFACTLLASSVKEEPAPPPPSVFTRYSSK